MPAFGPQECKADVGCRCHHTGETWHCKDGKDLHPQQSYFVGGQTKVYGAAMFRMRAEDTGYKKSYGKESHLAYLGHTLVQNRNGLIAAAMVTQADGYAEREAALLMLADKQRGRKRRMTVGADKAFDTKDFIAATRELKVTAHVTKNQKGRRSNLDRRPRGIPATPSA